MEIKGHYYEFRKRVDRILSTQYNLPQGNLSWVKDAKITHQPIAFFNKCNIFFDESSLPPICSFITDLSSKYILYGIFCNDKFYIGKTKDFGERMSTHIKDSRNNNSSQQLYNDMLECGECLTFIFGIAEDEETFDNMEHIIISECKNFSVEKECNFDSNMIKFIKESKADTKRYALKYCYNIID